jgi:hypothetical protein
MTGTAAPNANRGTTRRGQTLVVALLVFLSAVYGGPLRAAVQATFLYDLSNFTGPIRYSAPRIVVDRDRNEISVLWGNEIRVFNDRGMEIFSFGEDLDIGTIADLSVDSNGDILLLAYAPPPENLYTVVRCNFRGEVTGRIALKNLPDQFSGFSPSRLVCLKDKIYLADLYGLQVAITDLDGTFEDGYDLFQMLSLGEKTKGEAEIIGFSVTSDGSVLFTIPIFFSAYRIYPDRKVVSFGRPGSAPGKFNLVRGIAVDSRGNYFVVDRLKSTVQIFDKDFKYLAQFGYRGLKPGNLIAPDDVAVDASDRVYVTQNSKRGVSVYSVSY